MVNKLLYNGLLFFAVFAVLALPAVFVKKSETKLVSIQFPKDGGRQLASVPAEAKGDCHPVEKWRYRCDQNKENCVKDQKYTLLECKKSPKSH